MKLINGILGCALATGLMVFAANNAQSGVVIGNTLYSPLKLKLTIGVYNNKGSITKVSVTSKEVLKTLGYDKSTQLAINTGAIENNDVFVINKDSVLEDLTADGILTADVNELLDSGSEGKNGQFKYAASGVLSLYFYSNPQFFSEAITLIANNPNLDQSASKDASDYWFEISGLYSYSQKGSAVNNDSAQNINTKLKAGALSGVGYDVDLDAPYPTAVSGNASAKGSGKIVPRG